MCLWLFIYIFFSFHGQGRPFKNNNSYNKKYTHANISLKKVNAIHSLEITKIYSVLMKKEKEKRIDMEIEKIDRQQEIIHTYKHTDINQQ